MIRQITQEQVAAGRRAAKKWREIAAATMPVDREAFEVAVKAVYASAGMAAPTVRWYPSPIAGIVPAAFEISAGRPTVTQSLVADAVRVAVAAVRSEIDNEKIFSVLDKELAVGPRAIARPIADAVSMEIDIRASVIGDARPKTGKVLQKLVLAAVSSPSDNLGLIEFAHGVLGCPTCAVLPLARVGKMGWWWPFEATVIACELPVEILLDEGLRPHSSSGPAIRFSDGFEIYCHRGTRIPPEAVEGSGMGELDWNDVERTADRQVKSALASIQTERWVAKKRRVELATAPADGAAASAGAVAVESAEDAERRSAATAVQRLGGVGALRGLIEEEDE